MIKIVHNKKSAETTTLTSIATLGDLHRFIETCDLPAGRKAQIRSAVKRTDELVGHGALDLAANPAKLLAALDQYSSAMAGLSDGGFANLKSRLRAAFKLGRPHLISTRNVRLEGEWLGLHEQLVTREQRELSRFLRFACSTGWQLGQVGDDHVERFAGHLRDEAMIASWERVVRATIHAWNRVGLRYSHISLQPLTPPAPKSGYRTGSTSPSCLKACRPTSKRFWRICLRLSSLPASLAGGSSLAPSSSTTTASGC
jgi:hypothetical protein